MPIGAVLAGTLLLAGCGGAGEDAGPPPVDPAVRSYCDTVVRVQAEQTSPQAGQGGVAVASAAARKQVDDLRATAPPELAADWRTVSDLTDQALGSLAATRGDPNRIDRARLTDLEARSQPAVQRIKDVTAARCHVRWASPP
ncbi:hypothetical protein [Actinomycetospora soli]|uniref:hypothetical protein n=1 Tax=Actinomycetospora soli TaxID=2893887 RepID=UPI001E5BB097|nr:hypothetical protein [Actinomycetospora soli]MCD2186387.1 hypothetical protein [Actinomycetospora soli]